MSQYWGDYPVGATVRLPFGTYAVADGASITMTGFAASDVEIYKNGGTTQRASDNGYTATTDFDALTGLHMLVIDTSDNTDSGFFAAGNEYQVAVSTVTVDSETVSFWAGTFSIERSGGALALLKDSTYGLSALETLVDDLEGRLTATRAGYLDNLSGGAVALASGVNVTQISGDATAADNLEAALDGTGGVTITAALTGNITGNLSGSVGSLTTNNDKTGYRLSATGVDDIWDEAQSGHTTAGTFGKYLDNEVSEASAPTAGQVADAVWDEARADHTSNGTFGQGVASVQGHVTGSTASVTGNVGGNVAGSVASVAAAVTVGTNNDKTGYALSASGNNAVRDAVTDDVIEAQGSITVQQALSVILAALAGVTTDGGVTLKTPNGSATRIAATVNASNERTAITLTPSS